MIVDCYRGEGDRPGDAIVEPLLADTALVARGRAAMDANAHALDALTLSIVPRPGVRLGHLVQGSDPTSPRPWRGKVTGIRIQSSHGRIEQTLDIEVPK